MSAPRFHALVLAGSRGPQDPVAAAGGVSAKAFVEAGGRPMLARVVAALEASGVVEDIAVCLDPAAPVDSEAPELAARFADGSLTRVDPATTPSQSVLRAFEALPAGTPLLVTTADHPLLTAEMVRSFAAGAQTGGDAVAGLARMEAVAAAYPEARRTRLRFRDGGYAGCNLFAFTGPRAAAVLRFWGRMEAYRKSPWRLARAAGFGTLLGYAMGRLTLDAALRRLGR